MSDIVNKCNVNGLFLQQSNRVGLKILLDFITSQPALQIKRREVCEREVTPSTCSKKTHTEEDVKKKGSYNEL